MQLGSRDVPSRNRRTYRDWGAVTAISELKPTRSSQLRAVFLFGNMTTVAVRPLLEMRVIALARWTLFPDKREPTFLFFETNWSGSDQTYISDLARIMPFQWRSIWSAVKGFPGPLPTTWLLEYVDQVDRGVDHFWTDYDDGATTQVVARALELQPEVERFIKRTRDADAARFQPLWRDLLVRMQRLL
jgi:hypothetical protein